jgi:hypothetical protein
MGGSGPARQWPGNDFRPAASTRVIGNLAGAVVFDVGRSGVSCVASPRHA